MLAFDIPQSRRDRETVIGGVIGGGIALDIYHLCMETSPMQMQKLLLQVRLSNLEAEQWI